MENNSHRKSISKRTSSSRLTPSTIIVGGGWAGLACAIKLVKADHKITLFEASSYLGGRTSSIKHSKYNIDNGQHLCIGAYTTTLQLLQELNISEEIAFYRTNLQLNLQGNNKRIKFKLPKFCSPFHLFFGLLFVSGLTLKEKLLIAKLFFKLKKIDFTLTKDTTIINALQDLGQTNSLIINFWEPIALAVMSTPITIASAQVFLQVLKDVFTGSRQNSDWLFPKQDLGKILPIPAEQYLQSNGTTFIYKTPITSLVLDENNKKALGVTDGKQTWYADNIVIATPPTTAAKLLNQNLSIKYNTITTIYLIFAKSINVPIMTGFLDQPAQWAFNRKVAGQDNILSLIITDDLQSTLPQDKLLSLVIKQVMHHFPKLPEIIDTKIIQEKHAAFLCTTAAQTIRPSNITNIQNVFLAGDYTYSNYPATIEAAVRSGVKCADYVG